MEHNSLDVYTDNDRNLQVSFIHEDDDPRPTPQDSTTHERPGQLEKTARWTNDPYDLGCP